MENLELNKSIYGLNPNYPVFGRATAHRTVSNPVNIPQIKDSFVKKQVTASNDGKFSFLQFGKNIAKGSEEFFTDIYKNIVKHPFTSVPIMAVGAAIAATPAGLMFLTGAGITAGVFSLAFLGIKTINLISGKKWDELEKQGKDYGKLLPAAVINCIGAIKGVRQLETLTGVPNSTRLNALNKARTIGDSVSWNLMKNVVKSPYRALKKFILNKPVENGVLIKPIKQDYSKFVNQLSSSNKPVFTPKEITHLKKPNAFILNPKNLIQSFVIGTKNIAPSS